MEADAILRALTETDSLPKEALKAASARRAELVPLFLAAIEAFLAKSAELPTKQSALFYIFHLLGSWREKSAYRPLARLLRCRQADDVLGDATVSTSHRVMTAVFDGDPQPLYDVILDSSADEFIRSRACETLAMLVFWEELDRAEAVRFLREAFERITPQDCCYLWQGWQSAIAMLGASELKELVKEAFDRGFIDETWLGFHHFERDLAFAAGHPGKLHPGAEEYTMFGDTVAELSTWYGFSEQYEKDRERRRQSPRDETYLSEPYFNPFRRIGRNDPCPCGSGKKFKKCCMS